MDAPKSNAPYNTTTGNSKLYIYPEHRPKTLFGVMHAHNVHKRPYAAPCGTVRRNHTPLVDGAARDGTHPGGTTET